MGCRQTDLPPEVRGLLHEQALERAEEETAHRSKAMRRLWKKRMRDPFNYGAYIAMMRDPVRRPRHL